MRKLTLIPLLVLYLFCARAQTSDTSDHTKKDTSVFINVEQVPEFPGGLRKLIAYFDKNLKYPKEARENNIQGRVLVRFVVERDGSLTGIKVAKSLSPETDAEAIRLMNASPKWKPGMAGGRAVRVNYSIPVYFRMNN